MLDAIDYGERVIGPVVYEYVSWILFEAQKQRLDSLYFLARDGFLLQKVAEEICNQNNYAIQCKYLYCSRMSLRMPTYHFIGEEAYDLLLQGGYHITPYMLMCRLGLNEKERLKVYNEVGITEENRAITPMEFQQLALRIKHSKYYTDFMYSKSKASYENIIGYFKQEGVLDNSHIVLVDSGWSGSMQRSMRQLLEHEGYQGRIEGFYFGLFNEPKEKKDGEYKAFYFDTFVGMKKKLYFDNTMFECMLSAPHGMTVGFSFDGMQYKPILKEDMNIGLSNFIGEQIDGALKYAKKEIIRKETFIWKESVKKVYKILKRAMVFPTRYETEAYSRFKFCDDVSEASPYNFIRRDMPLQLKNYMLVSKIMAKISHTDDIPIDDVFWPYGVVTYTKYPIRLWYRWNIMALQFFRYTRTAIKEKRRVSEL